MKQAAQSVLAFGGYLVCVAVVLMVAPNLLLGLVGIAPTSEPWIRVLGIVTGALGTYYILAARMEFTAFLRATVWIRAWAMLGFVALVIAGLAPATLVAFGLVDGAGALWTWMALKSATADGARSG